MPGPRTMRAPPTRGPGLYRWSLVDHRMDSNNRSGTAETSDKAKGDAILALKRIGRGLTAIGITVTRPSGRGGWFCRTKPDGLGFTWEPWEKE